MVRGDGKLLVPTRRGVRECRLAVSAPGALEPDRWAQHCACAWTAAWLTVRGRDWRGPREVLADPQLEGQVRWMSRNGPRHHGHRPDLAVVIPSGVVAIEVDVDGSSDDHRSRVLTMYERWVASERLVGVIYICRSDLGADRIARLANHQGLDQLRVEVLSTIRAQAEERPPRQLQLPGFKWPYVVTT